MKNGNDYRGDDAASNSDEYLSSPRIHAV